MEVFIVVSLIATWSLLLVIAVAVLALYRHFGQLYINSDKAKEVQGPQIGSSILSFGSKSISDGSDINFPFTQGSSAILFTDTACDLCAELRDQIGALGNSIPLVVACSGPQKDVVAWASVIQNHAEVVWDRHSALMARYKVNGTPYVIIVGSDGRIYAKSIVNGEEGLSWILAILQEANEHLTYPEFFEFGARNE